VTPHSDPERVVVGTTAVARDANDVLAAFLPAPVACERGMSAHRDPSGPLRRSTYGDEKVDFERRGRL